MGAKAWFIAYSEGAPKEALSRTQRLDRDTTRTFAKRLFPDVLLQEDPDGTLDFLNPEDGKVFVGCYEGVRIVAHTDLGGDFPSRIDHHWLDPSFGRQAYLHATHSVVDWFAFGVWREGQLIRALSVSSDDGIIEQLGPPLSFERPYWDGAFPLEQDDGDDAYPLPFHPLELSEASMLANMGYQFEGYPGDWNCDPTAIPIMAFSMPPKKNGDGGGGGVLNVLAAMFGAKATKK